MKFIEHTGIVVPLDIANIDTDVIISKQFLQGISRDNFGKYLFSSWRFCDDLCDKLNNDFVLNYPNFQNASILLTRENFGCGSSREHAVWALIDYGFRVILSESFADIFYINSVNNQLLLIDLPRLIIDELFKKISLYKNDYVLLTVNLEIQKIFFEDVVYSFKINDFYRYCMLNDFDHIGRSFIYEDKIKDYENNQLIFLK